MVGVEVADVGVAGVAAAQSGLVRKHAAHFFGDVVHAVREEDAVIVAFGHLAAVQAGALGRRGEHGLGFGEELAVKIVEAPGDFAGQLHVGQLVFAHRHAVRSVHKDVRRHEHGIAEEARIAQVFVADLLLLFLVGGVALQPGNGRDHRQQERKLRVLLDVGLAEDDALFRVQASAHPIFDHFVDVAADLGGVGVVAGQGVPVGHKKVGFFRVLQFHPVFEHAEVVAKVQGPRGPHAGNSARFAVHQQSPFLTEYPTGTTGPRRCRSPGGRAPGPAAR